MADTKQTAHTPTPFWVEDYGEDTVAILSGEIGKHTMVASILTGEEDAAYIVRCVNSHELLVEALKAIAEVCKLEPVPGGKTWEDQWWSNMRDARKLAEAALKQAGGE